MSRTVGLEMCTIAPRWPESTLRARHHNEHSYRPSLTEIAHWRSEIPAFDLKGFERMFRSLHCEDFEVNDILLPDEAALRRFIARRFEGDSNRFIMSFDRAVFPNITVFVRGNECVVHYVSKDGEPHITTGDRSRNDLVPFKDYYVAEGIRDVSDIPGGAIIPWSLGERCALEFARNGGRFAGVDWEEP